MSIGREHIESLVDSAKSPDDSTIESLRPHVESINELSAQLEINSERASKPETYGKSITFYEEMQRIKEIVRPENMVEELGLCNDFTFLYYALVDGGVEELGVDLETHTVAEVTEKLMHHLELLRKRVLTFDEDILKGRPSFGAEFEYTDKFVRILSRALEEGDSDPSTSAAVTSYLLKAAILNTTQERYSFMKGFKHLDESLYQGHGAKEMVSKPTFDYKTTLRNLLYIEKAGGFAEGCIPHLTLSNIEYSPFHTEPSDVFPMLLSSGLLRGISPDLAAPYKGSDSAQLVSSLKIYQEDRKAGKYPNDTNTVLMGGERYPKPSFVGSDYVYIPGIRVRLADQMQPVFENQSLEDGLEFRNLTIEKFPPKDFAKFVKAVDFVNKFCWAVNSSTRVANGSVDPLDVSLSEALEDYYEEWVSLCRSKDIEPLRDEEKYFVLPPKASENAGRLVSEELSTDESNELIQEIQDFCTAASLDTPWELFTAQISILSASDEDFRSSAYSSQIQFRKRFNDAMKKYGPNKTQNM